MSDIEGSWKPNGRPQSTIARNFSAALNDAFSIDSSLDDNLKGLVRSVEQKKRAVSSQAQELEALEARLRETEERLKRSQPEKPSSMGRTGASNSTHHRLLPGQAFSSQENDRLRDTATSPSAAHPRKVPMVTPRADSYRTPPMPGALPQTPGVASSADY